MKGYLIGGAVVIGIALYAINRISAQDIEELPAELPPSEQTAFAKSISDEVELERERVSQDYWNRWGKENIVTMADKMWDYQMDRYDLWEEGKIDRFRWNNAMMPPSIFY